MQWFHQQPKALIGIDIDARYIKLIVLTKTTPVTIAYFSVQELPMMVLTENLELKDHATISATLTQLKVNHPALCSEAAIALPGSSVVTKQIILDTHLTDIHLEEQVWLEAGKYFPDLIEDLSLDFHVHGPNETDNSKLDVLLVACRKTSIEQRIAPLVDSHFQVKVVDVDYYALERALRYQLKHHPEYSAEHSYALINFNSRASTLVVVQNDRLLYAHDQSFDTQRLAQKLSQELNWPNFITQREALPSSLTSDAISLLEAGLIGHIRHALQLFMNSATNPIVECLFLAGDCAMIPMIADLLSTQLAQKTLIANPLIAMQINPDVDQQRLSLQAPLLTLC